MRGRRVRGGVAALLALLAVRGWCEEMSGGRYSMEMSAITAGCGYHLFSGASTPVIPEAACIVERAAHHGQPRKHRCTAVAGNTAERLWQSRRGQSSVDDMNVVWLRNIITLSQGAKR